MGLKVAYSIYFIITVLWSTFTFIALLPEIKSLFYTKCVWSFNFQLCDKIIGIEGGYRFTISVTLFYIALTFLTLNINNQYSLWFHQDCWILKVVILLICNVIGFVIPFSRTTMDSFYYIILTFALFFIVVIFILYIDAAHAFKLFWLRKAKENMNVPTCYMCTWLFVLHLVTSLLYAVSVDLILAFVFFNNMEECLNVIIFAGVNVCLCLISFGISCYPSLRDRQCSSQIIFSSVLAVVSYTTWLALSDPQNEYCNMQGTIFTGSLLDSSESFRSIASLVCGTISLYFLCAKSDMLSYTRSLISNTESDDTSIHIYSSFHIAMAFASSFVLMSVTNHYEPVYTQFRPIPNPSKSIRTSVIYFEGYNRYRFISMCILSTFLPLFYITMLISRIVKDCIIQKKNVRMKKVEEEELIRTEESKESSCVFDNENEFLFIPMIRSKALYMMKHKHSHESFNLTDPRTDFLLLPCFAILDHGLSFWHFPRFVSQTYFKGRNGSNACTIIAMIFGRFFSRSDIPFQETGYLSDTWIKLYNESIEEGSMLYDSIVKELGVLDLSIEEVAERFGSKMNVRHLLPSLAVSFESDVDTATVLHQLQRLISYGRKQVVLFIHKTRTSAFLIFENEEVLYADSHAFGENGSILLACRSGNNLPHLVNYLKELLGNNENRLSTLTQIQYEERWNYSKLY